MTEVESEVWVYNGVEFKVGDSVQVAFNPCAGSAGTTVELQEHFVKDGMGPGVDWDNTWVQGMDYAVGGIYEIMDIREQGVEFVQYVDEITLHPHGGYLYPLSILRKM